MKLLVYASDENQRKRLLKAIGASKHQCKLVIVVDFSALHDQLVRNCWGEVWLLLVSKSPAELDGLVALGNLIQNRCSILVLPDHRHETLTAGHSLYPRFISYLDSDWNDVGSVLEQVVTKSEESKVNSTLGGRT